MAEEKLPEEKPKENAMTETARENPVATGAVGGAVAGAIIGTGIAGPVGTAVGAVIGAVVGAGGGEAARHMINKDAETAHWREQHEKQSYAEKEMPFEHYEPAYRAGMEGPGKHALEQDRTFEEAEPHLRQEYEATGAGANLPWEKAKPAAQAAWTRVQAGQAVRVPISEERVDVTKREVEGDTVRVRKEVHTETVHVPVELRREEVVVERTFAKAGEVPEDAFREGEVRIPLKREEAVVQKSAHVVGSVEVRKREETEHRDISETVRKEDVRVEHEEHAPEKEDEKRRAS